MSSITLDEFMNSYEISQTPSVSLFVGRETSRFLVCSTKIAYPDIWCPWSHRTRKKKHYSCVIVPVVHARIPSQGPHVSHQSYLSINCKGGIHLLYGWIRTPSDEDCATNICLKCGPLPPNDICGIGQLVRDG